jgi:hypothetical protein
MHELIQWAKDHPVYATSLAYLLIGAFGELGQALTVDYPRAAKFFAGLSRFGTALFSMYRLAAPKVPPVPDAPDSEPSTKDLSRRDERGSALLDFVGSLGFLGIVVVLIVLLGGCVPAKDATAQRRATARGTVLVLAEAVRVADEACAARATATKDLALAETCAQAYSDARIGAITAAAAVDAWDAGSKAGVVCGVASASKNLGNITAALRKAGLGVPAIVDDAARLVSLLFAAEGTCQ